MKSPVFWFVLLSAVCLVAPYLLGVQPKTRRHWTWIAVTITFLAWLLPLMISVRSR